MEWLQQTATGKQHTLSLDPSHQEGGESPEAVIGNPNKENAGGEDDGTAGGTIGQRLDGLNADIPLTWAEVRESSLAWRAPRYIVVSR